MSSFTWEIIGLLVIMLPFWLFYRALQRAQKSAIALYESFGFEREGYRRRHYRRADELLDAVLMAYEVTPTLDA